MNRPMNVDGHTAKKRFGQNFLHDPNVIDRILRAIQPQPGQHLVEIGPGMGALTSPLLQRCGSLDVVEIDRDVIPHLLEACGHDPRLRITEADALRLDYHRFAPKGERLRVVGNLPYNISSPLLFHLLSQADVIQDMHFMLQKEVVDRMCAVAGDKDYGRLSVSLAARCEVAHLIDVGPGAFRPPPKVHSAVVRLQPRPPTFELLSWPRFDQVVTLAFAQRRKTLRNALKGLADAEDFAAADVDAGARAERISPAAFAALANRIETSRSS